MKPIDQKELVTNLKNGHEASFTLLYNTYGQKIYNQAYRMVGNKQKPQSFIVEALTHYEASAL
jgi:DNA-directed RNA polymerase specialized sigma24 family protein